MDDKSKNVIISWHWALHCWQANKRFLQQKKRIRKNKTRASVASFWSITSSSTWVLSYVLEFLAKERAAMAKMAYGHQCIRGPSIWYQITQSRRIRLRLGKNRCLINPFPLLLLMLMGQTITILGVFLSLFGKLLDLKKDYTDCE